MTGRRDAKDNSKWCTKSGLVLFALMAILLGWRVWQYGIYEYRDGYPEYEYGTVIGIDLGNTHARVAYQTNGTIRIMKHDGGSTIPSVVKLTNSGLKHISHTAKGSKPIFYAKEYLGMNWDELLTKKLLPADSFATRRVGDRMAIQVHTDKGEKLVYPEEVASAIISKLKDMAEKDLGRKVTHTLLSVPPGFTDIQREALKAAVKMAGLEILHIYNGCTAAGISYNLDVASEERNFLYFDLGGQTLQVAVVEADIGVFDVLSSTSVGIGGRNLTQGIVDHFIETIYRKRKIDMGADKTMFNQLYLEAYKAKEALSSADDAQLSLVEATSGSYFTETLTRAEFEAISEDLFKKMLTMVKQTVKDANLKMEDIDDVILTGGSSHIPKIQNLLKDLFQKDVLFDHKDEAIVKGLALQTMNLMQPSPFMVGPSDINPLTIGIETSGGIMEPIMKRFTMLPSRKSRIVSTATDNQSSMKVTIFLGESNFVKNNFQIASLVLADIPPAPAGVPQIEVSAEVIYDNSMVIKARDQATGREVIVKTPELHSILSQEDIDKLAEERETWLLLEKDFSQDQTIMKRNSFRGYLAAVDKSLADMEPKTARQRKTEIKALTKLIETNKEWAFNQANTATESDLSDRLHLLREGVYPVLGEVDFKPIPAVGEPVLLAHDEL